MRGQPPQGIKRKRDRDIALSVLETIVKKMKPNNIEIKQTVNTDPNFFEESGRPVKYDENVMKFALTLRGYSTKAYNFVRETFDDALPSNTTLNRHLSKLNSGPGFKNGPFDVIRRRFETMGFLPLSVSVDDISIREHVQLLGNNLYGHEDQGEGPGPQVATHAMVIMCTNVFEAWKIPLSYFLIGNSFSGMQRAKLVDEAIMRLKETGAIITNIVCDNTAVNITMLKILGADISHENLNPVLSIKNVDGSQIYAYMDPPHLLKLTRNTLGDYKVLIDGEGRKIEWTYIMNLHRLQQETQIHLCNKLKKPHVAFRKNPMSVKLAAQTLSKSVADSLQFCCTDLRLPEFANAEATVDFITCFDLLFDVMNSRSRREQYSKAVLRESNKHIWMETLRKASIYIQGLKHAEGTPVLHGRRKAAFLGWLLNIDTLKRMFFTLVTTGPLYFLATYKLSQGK